jgi:hypothetical protein
LFFLQMLPVTNTIEVGSPHRTALNQ